MNNSKNEAAVKNSVVYANGFELYAYDDFTLIKVTRPWPDATQALEYVVVKPGGVLPDSLARIAQIKTPIQRLIATSTTHIPALEMLGGLDVLKGFPGLNYISSPAARQRIDRGAIREIGLNENLNTELVLDLKPEVIVAFGLDANNAVLNTLEQSGIAVVYNGDWAELSPLGKAEWIKLFGVLLGKELQAKEIFDQIVLDYDLTLKQIGAVAKQPTVLSGAMYEDVWYLPQGQSWAALYFKDAQSNYLWKDSEGTGSLALSFEAVFDQAEQADFWINPGAFESLDQLAQANPHYKNFKAFKTGQLYSFSPTKGATGGVLFYELGPSRPDLVLKDLVSIFHPDIFPNHQRVFYQALK